jgi:3-oxoacyl-[acyl-carrier protein] reductase
MSVSGLVYNFSNPEASKEALQSLLQIPLDGLVLNAFTRVSQLRKLHAISYPTLRSYLDDNLHGNIWLIHHLLPHLLANKFGRLILISSLSAITGTSRYGAYCTTKAALEGLFLNLAVDYSANNILSNIVRVGLIKTSRTEQFWKRSTYQEKMAQIIPQGMMGESTQVAEAMDPLLSQTSFMTGSVITVSGGLPLMRSEGLLS